MPPKLDFKRVKEFIESEGCELLSVDYRTNKQLLDVKCGDCEETYQQTFDRFKRGNRHKVCSGKVRKIEERPVKPPKICKHCKQSFVKRSGQMYCDKKCLAKHQKVLFSTDPAYRERCRQGGLASAALAIKRSKNEILFAESCAKYFNVLTNVRMFDGWDADVIIPSLKIAVHWDGIWHHRKVRPGQNLPLIQNRDRIKRKRIAAHGYVSYTINDMGGYKPLFVQEQVQKFLDFVYFT